MDASGVKLKDLLESDELVVPFFQRPYVWREEQFEALLDSVNESAHKIMPFFGSVILKETEGPDVSKYQVIDGQQRCITFNVLVRALLDACGNNLSAIQMSRLDSCVYINIEDDDGNEIGKTRLIPSNVDKSAFDRVMNKDVDALDKLDDDSQEAIEKAYQYFYNYFLENPDKVKEFYLKLIADNRSIIKITLSEKDDEQKIFDSVNSLGKSLSNADIIKNYIFQKLQEKAGDDGAKKEKISSLYSKHWDAIFYAEDKKRFWDKEFAVGRLITNNLECFLKDFAVIKKVYQAKKSTGVYGLCNAYKQHINGMTYGEIVEFLEELHEYAVTYYNYKTTYEELGDFEWSDYQNRLLLILDELDTTTFNPYVLDVLNNKPDEAERRFYNLEKFLLTRFFYAASNKNYNQCCEKLLSADDDKAYLSDYVTKESPVNNSTYKIAFRKFTNKQARLVLFLIEMLYRSENEGKYSDGLRLDNFSLEHIMPQKWQTHWSKVDAYDEDGTLIDQGNKEELVQKRETAIGSLGNMTLLTQKLNVTISNSDMATKMYGKPNSKSKACIVNCAASLQTTQKVIAEYNSTKTWNEIAIYRFEEKYYSALNGFYSFDEYLPEQKGEASHK